MISEQEGTEVYIITFVHSVVVKAHDLILIPFGTVHCSGEGNLVLEISATPYIFTFKIYDYLRKDLNGNLRKLNIERAFENIRDERTSDFINSNYLPEPKLIEKGKDWENYELYNRDESFYNINRLEFQSECILETKGAPGEKGEQGAVGERGPTGIIGVTGPPGFTKGSLGPMGLRGNYGPMCPQGGQGERGFQGKRGMTGDPANINHKKRSKL